MHPLPKGEGDVAGPCRSPRGISQHPALQERLSKKLTWENELLLVLVVMGSWKRGKRS